MKDEIKEILQTLEGIASGNWIQMLPKEAIKLLNYITNLQEENEHLRTQVNTYKNVRDKAIEYIHWRYDNREDMYITQMKEFLNILQGEDNE